ncbi:hypothetical protein [Janthinobacterium sp. LB3P118]|uniref:hypothetical protein n=1 Tax=Janthinobacterium sp. LB3P118 TaxID=3424195 RepID=UPI003F282E90
MQYDFNLPPGGALNLDVKGRFFKYRSGTGAIRVRASKGGYVDLLPGQGVWSLDFESLNVQDRSGVQNTGVLIAGDFDFHDDRITGTVDIMDGGRTRTLANTAFLADTAISPGASFATLQLWNPVGSGKNVMLEQMTISVDAGTSISMWDSTAPKLTPGQNPSPKLLGGATGVARTFMDNPGAAYSGVRNGSVNCQANGTFVFPMREPIVIPPGRGFVVQSGTITTILRCMFEFFEEPL